MGTSPCLSRGSRRLPVGMSQIVRSDYGEPVQAVDNDLIDSALTHQGEYALRRRPVQRPAGAILETETPGGQLPAKCLG